MRLYKLGLSIEVRHERTIPTLELEFLHLFFYDWLPSFSGAIYFCLICRPLDSRLATKRAVKMSQNNFESLRHSSITLSLYEARRNPSAPQKARSVWHSHPLIDGQADGRDKEIPLSAYPTHLAGCWGGMYEIAELPGALLKVPKHMSDLICESL